MSGCCGKELVAGELHYGGPRGNGPFVPVPVSRSSAHRRVIAGDSRKKFANATKRERPSQHG